MKIRFIHAKRRTDVSWYHPLAFGYLKAYLSTYLPGVSEMEWTESLEEIADCDLLAISSTSQDYNIACRIAEYAKQVNPRIITVLGGHHISYLPKTLSESFDIGVLGEGEATFLDVVKACFDGSDISAIPGVAYHGDGGVVITEPRCPIMPMDSIPIPYRDARQQTYLMSSRGCPYHCTFCTSTTFWKKARFFSAEYVLEDIKAISTIIGRRSTITVQDDLFIADHKRFEKIIGLIEDAGMSNTTDFSFSVRANLVTDDLCRLINRIHVSNLCFGAESGSDRILKLMGKGTTVAMNQRAIDIMCAHGFPATCSFIVGWPTETEAEVRSTYEFIERNKRDGKLSDTSAVNVLMPMPGTSVWRDAVARGLVSEDGFDWDRLGIWACHKHSTAGSFDEWADGRRRNQSVYLNEATLPAERLYGIMSEYETARA